MKTSHHLIAGIWPATSILARRIVFLLLVLGAGLMLVRPCAGAPFTFENTGSLGIARTEHTATLLTNGKVLVVGGQGSGQNFLASAELYDPATGTWTTTGSLLTARIGHTATLLKNGKVLVGGQDSHFTSLTSAELYDPGNWDLEDDR